MSTVTVERGSKGNPEHGSLWEDESGNVYILLHDGKMWTAFTLKYPDRRVLRWSSSKNSPEEASADLKPFHGRVVIES